MVASSLDALDWGAAQPLCHVPHSCPNSAHPPQVVASSLDALDSVLLSNFRSKDDLVCCLKASAAVPEVAGGFVEHR